VSLGDALITFVSVFVAALLAFYLDGLRERRATAAWVREYLGFWRGFLQSTAGDAETNDAIGHRLEAGLDAWLAATEATPPTWADIDALNVNAAVRFSGPLLSTGGSVVPPELMHQLFVADAMAPALGTRGDFAVRLFEAEVRPLVLARVVPLEGTARRVVETYRVELLGLFEQSRDYAAHLAAIREELVRLGY
jgi:hypothetical protein